MNTEPQLGEAGLECPSCGATIPVGRFCAMCGMHLHLTDTNDTGPMRSHAYAAAASEHVLRLSVVSSLFPHLPHRSRAPFRSAFAVLILLLLALAALRLQAPLIAVSVLGFPILFLLYLIEAEVYEATQVSRLIACVALGVVLGWGWSLLTARRVAAELTTALVAGVHAGGAVTAGVLIPLGGLALMLCPVVVLRILRPAGHLESLDGFLLGSLGALGFAFAATLVRLEPQLRTGLVANGRSIASLVVEAMLQGALVPLTAAGVGGIFGATIWAARRSQEQSQIRRGLPVWVLGAAALLYVSIGLVDVLQLADGILLLAHAAVAAFVLIGLRLGLQMVLIAEEHDAVPTEPYLCGHCEQLVPGTPFCPHCGTASRAAARHRQARLARITTPPGQAS